MASLKLVTVVALSTVVVSGNLHCDDCPADDTLTDQQPGDLSCSFASTLCTYRQSCTSDGGPQWTQREGWVELLGTGQDYQAYSTLQAAMVHVASKSCLRFYFAQTLPSKLTAVANGRCIFTAPDAELNTFAVGQVDISAGNFSMAFRGQNLARKETWVRLKDVTLQPGSCPRTPRRKPTVIYNQGSNIRGRFAFMFVLAVFRSLLTS